MIGEIRSCSARANVIYNCPSRVRRELRNPDLEMNNYYAAFTGKNPDQTAFISLQHDVYAETVQNLATRAINYVRGLGYQVVDMGTCMGGGVWDCYQQ